MSALLSPTEVAEFAKAPKRMVDKAVEEAIIAGRVVRKGRSRRRLLPLHAVAYVATVRQLPLKLGVSQKRRIERSMSRLAPGDFRTATIEIAPALSLDVGRLVGDAVERADLYARDRDRYIVEDEEIFGGTPII